MPTPSRILAFSGSARRESLNRKLLAAVIEAVGAVGGEVTTLDLNDYPLPLYHGDLEDNEGLPPNATKLIEAIAAHDALLIASPEYNSQMTPLLKNTIDWCTRGDENPLRGKVAAVVSASPGMFGGIRSMTLARQLLTHLGCYVIPAQCVLPYADKAFDPTGRLQDARTQKAVVAVATDLVRVAGKLA
ncbi:MAG TPA: NAD(P)H-dependent oxidoreductase [Opitutaceae bacterium]|nr:NAD(P)H-dependent oxidoreductase [Opitutaceae bacterium]